MNSDHLLLVVLGPEVLNNNTPMQWNQAYRQVSQHYHQEVIQSGGPAHLLTIALLCF